MSKRYYIELGMVPPKPSASSRTWRKWEAKLEKL